MPVGQPVLEREREYIWGRVRVCVRAYVRVSVCVCVHGGGCMCVCASVCASAHVHVSEEGGGGWGHIVSKCAMLSQCFDFCRSVPDSLSVVTGGSGI